MANSASSVVNQISLASEQDLGDLQPIDENKPTSVHLLTDEPPIDDSEISQHTSEQTGLTQDLNDRAIRPQKATEFEQDISKSSQIAECSHPQPSNTASETFKSSNNPPRTIRNRQNAVDADPHAQDFRRESTFGSKNSETFEQTKAWDRKAVLSLGKLRSLDSAEAF